MVRNSCRVGNMAECYGEHPFDKVIEYHINMLEPRNTINVQGRSSDGKGYLPAEV